LTCCFIAHSSFLLPPSSFLLLPDDRAAATFVAAAELYDKVEANSDALKAYLEGARQYKNASDFKNADQYFMISKQKNLNNNRFANAAKIEKEVAQMYEDNTMSVEARSHWSAAAECYEHAEQSTSVNQCLLKVADHCANAGDYKEAIDKYDGIIHRSLNNSLAKWSVSQHMFKAIMCQFSIDVQASLVENTRTKLESYVDLNPAFENTREQKLMVKLLDAYGENDIEAFVAALTDYDRITKLDNLQTSILLDIKKKMEVAGLDVLGTEETQAAETAADLDLC
jgi:tetratricopeptide (TPR) repeat protein